MSLKSNALQRYTSSADEEAFGELVETHLGLVFGTAMRRTGDRSLSEEIAQNVFAALASKAGELRSAAALPAWLHRATVLESSKAIRGEARRRQRMEKLIEIHALDGEGIEAWRHAQIDLDEALDELPAADRALLLQRFYGGETFAQIAAGNGKSEAANQKQASRALAKLGELMKARGFAVPVAVLASGLGIEFAKAAPVGMAASIASAALTSVPSAAAAGGMSAAVPIMTTTKSTFLGAGLALLLVTAFIGGGYVVGRGKAEDERDAKRVAMAKDGAVRAGAAEAGGATLKSGIKPAARSSLSEILAAAAQEFALREEDDEAEKRGRKIIGRVRADEVQAALKEVQELEVDGDTRQLMYWEIVSVWARYEGEAAADFALANDSSDQYYMGIRAAMRGWIAVAPQSAYRWLRKITENADAGIPSDHRRSLLYSNLRLWAMADPAAAMDELAGMPYDDQRQLAGAFETALDVPTVRDAYLTALAEFPDAKLRSRMIDDAVGEWSSTDPEGAAQWFETLKFENEMLGFKPAAELAENWFERDPRAAVDWLWGKTPEAVREEFVDDFVRREWGRQDAAGAAAWLKENGFSEEVGK